MSAPTPGFAFSGTTPAAPTGMQIATPQSDNGTPQQVIDFAVPNTGGVSLKTADYTLAAADCGKLLAMNSASPHTFTLPATPPSVADGAGVNHWQLWVANIGAGTLTLAVTSPALLDGAATALSIPTSGGMAVFTDGTNYYTQRGSGAAGAGITLKHDGTLNGSQTLLDLKHGTGIAITDDGVGGLTIATQSTVVPSLRGSNLADYASASSTATASVTLPAGSAAGDDALIFFGCDVSYTNPSGWTILDQVTASVWVGFNASKTLTSADITAGQISVATSGAFGWALGIVVFNGSTGGVREHQFDSNNGGTSGKSLSTTSAVQSTDAGIYFTSLRSPITTTPSIVPASGSATLLQAHATATSGMPVPSASRMASQGMPGGALSVAYNGGPGVGSGSGVDFQVVVKGVSVLGNGTVTSVSASVPSDFAVTVSNPTSTPAIAITGGPTRSAIQQESYTYAADTGSANAYAVTLSPAPTLVAGSVVCFKAANANTGASTLAVNGGTATAIKKNGNTTALASADIAAGQIVTAKYDGTVWQILVPGTGGGGSSITLQTNGTNNGSQTTLNLAAGSNVTLADNGSGTVTIAATGGGGGGGALVQIGKQVLASAAASVTFSGISGSYTNLVLRYTARSSGAQSDLYVQCNADTGSNYDYAAFFSGSSSGNLTSASTANPPFGSTPPSTAPAGAAGAGTITIHDYAGTTFNKRVTGLYGRIDSTTGIFTVMVSGEWKNTAAVTSIKLGMIAAVNFVAGSTFTLYAEL